MSQNRKFLKTAAVFALLMSGIFVLVLYATNTVEERVVFFEEFGLENATDVLFGLRFEYVVNSNACDSDVSTVIIVTSYFADVEARSAMRRAFPREKLQQFKMKRVFLLGLEAKNKYISQNSIADESKRFNDIVQGNFFESYKNLTYKHVMGHKWVSEHCRRASYVIKMDDDIVVNFYKLREVLFDMKWKNFMAGYVLKNMKPIRENHNKWFVTQKEYGQSDYPIFLSGWLYVTTPKISESISRLSHSVPYFWIDDVYVTGIIAEKLKIPRMELNQLFTVHPQYLLCCMEDLIRSGHDCQFVVGPNGGDDNLFYKFNKVMSRCFYGKCKKRSKLLNETCVAPYVVNVGRGDAEINKYKLF